MKRFLRTTGVALAVGGLLSTSLTAFSFTPSGAIFTTVANGTEVNLNQYPSKDAVYLDGGPGPGAPATAAGLDDGTYVFQVTDPPGKKLLSSDPAGCRQFVVHGGLITGVVAYNGCQHATGLDVDHNARTVQLIPYANTPNKGGVYKVWAERVEDYLVNCAALTNRRPLDVADCGDAAANHHGFVPSNSKTDNFKVKNDSRIREIDTIFFRDLNGDGWWGDDEPLLEGLTSKWTDTLGVTNSKYSYFVSQWNIIEAHVEAVEDGVHYITIPDLSAQGCVVTDLWLDQVWIQSGPGTVKVDMSGIPSSTPEVSKFVKVACAA